MILTIQNVLVDSFIALIAAPLPILLISGSFGSIKNWYAHQSYLKVIKKHYTDLEMVGVDELKAIFPDKRTEELEMIAGKLITHNLSYSS